MRKREPDTAAVIPHPCTHPIVTWEGDEAPACLRGYGDLGPPYPRAAAGTPEGDAMEAAIREHWTWEGLRAVAVAGLLMPDGQPWGRRPWGESW